MTKDEIQEVTSLRKPANTLDALVDEVNSTTEGREAFDTRLAVLEAARFVKDMRHSCNLTQAELAVTLGVDQAVVGRIETARGERGPTVAMLRRIARACSMKLVLSAIPDSGEITPVRPSNSKDCGGRGVRKTIVRVV